MTPAKLPVTTEDKCDRRWSTTRWVVGGLTAIGGGLLFYSLEESRLAMSIGYTAESTAEKVGSDLKNHGDVQKEHDRHIDNTLKRIEDSQADILTEIKQLRASP